MKSHFFLRLLTVCWLVGLPLVSRGQEAPNGKQITERALVADTTAVEPGKPFYVGIQFKLIEGWHTYWEFPGSPGLPLTAKWTLPPGWTAGEVEFPLPHQLSDPHGVSFFGYEHEVVFPVKITPTADAKGQAIIKADLVWQVCEQSCIRGKGEVSLKIATGKAEPANKALFDKWLGQLPQSADETVKVSFTASGRKLTVKTEGVADGLKPVFFPLPPEGFAGTLEFGEKLVSEKGTDGVWQLGFPWDEELGADLKWGGLLVMESADGGRKGWYVGESKKEEGRGEKVETAGATVLDADGWDPFDDIAKGEKNKEAASGGLLLLLVQGFFGGLLLNLMPCVLPVISLKIFGFVRQAGESKQRVFHLGLAFCAGVFGFFLALAILVLALSKANSSLGWGSQFSNPIALTIMVAVIFVFSLSLLGVFEITLGGGTTNKLSEASGKEGLGGAFMHGFFTTLLGTSCTAPLVGPVIGAAVNQPSSGIFLLFGSVATGLSLPYFLLTWQPAWMRFLPKPGTWMVRFKQVLGFIMLAFAMWLLNSLPTVDVVVYVLGYLLVIGFGCWLLGSYYESRWPLAVMLALVVGGWMFLIRDNVKRPPVEIPKLVADVKAGLKAGRPVFVDFTAKWCANCVYFEKTVIDTEPVQKAFRDKNVLFVKADFTTSPPDIEEALKKCGRAGVPLYVLFRKRGDYWIADGLTQSGLLEELNKLPGKN